MVKGVATLYLIIAKLSRSAMWSILQYPSNLFFQFLDKSISTTW